MIALVRFCGQRPVTCGARPLLFSAQASLERRDLIAAGCRLREALRLYLLAECEYHDCVPPKNGKRSPIHLAKSLRAAGVIQSGVFSWIAEILDVGNGLAHLVLVRPAKVECCISLVHRFLDSSPYLVEVGGAEGRRV